MSNVADQELGEFPNQFLGLQPYTNPVTSNAENLVNAPIKLNTEVATSGPSGGASLHSGTGSPQGVVAAGSGAFYFRTDAPSVSNERLYVCTVGGATAAATTWVAIL